jgi:NADH-quinone oxidoreductase subunit N
MLEQLNHVFYSTAAIAAEICSVCGIVLLVLLIAFGKKNKAYRAASWGLTFLTIIICFLFVYQAPADSFNLFNGLFQISPVSNFGKELILITTLGVLLHIRVMKYDLESEYFIILLAIITGLLFLLMANHFVSIFIALETVSICSYLLVAMSGKTPNLEAGIKYLIFGAASTAIMLFGMSLFFGATGSLNFSSELFQNNISQNQDWIILTALGLVLAGPLFKLSAAPFHIWAPDVYEATPTPFVSFLAVVPKIAAIFLIKRLLESIPIDTTTFLSIVVFLSIFIGNFAAISQENAKRMMGYSGIAQAGFILIGLLAFQLSGFQASVFYLAIYIFMSLGAFLLLDIISKQTNSYRFVDMAGLSQKFVSFGVIGLIFMIGLVGLPPASGFTAKFLVFSSLYEQYSFSGQKILLGVLVFGLINTAVSIYYYLKIPYFMFMKKPQINLETQRIPVVQLVYLSLLAVIVLALFFAPQLVQERMEGLF